MSLTKWRTAIHTAGGLDFPFDGCVFFVIAAFDGVEFFPVKDTAGGVAVGFLVSLVVDETAEFFDGLVGAVAAFYSVVTWFEVKIDVRRGEVMNYNRLNIIQHQPTLLPRQVLTQYTS